MKKFKDVEQTRILSHRDPTRDSVHRSSLLVPELPGASAEISFVNHFLLKRGYKNVACRVTAIDAEGGRIESRLHPVTEPRAYRFPLTGSFASPVETYLVDFYAAENLFIPFPAVMVNHSGPGFLNTVHAFNRVLNDVFENDAINVTPASEASIDVDLSKGRDTFAVFAAGATACEGELVVDLTTSEGRRCASIPIREPRFGQHVVSLRETFPDLPDSTTGILKILQPAQFMFYGRMLAGIRTPEGSFSANHSYYDTSATPEYWQDGRTSFRSYPCFRSLRTVVRMYPIQSPGCLAVSVGFHARSGQEIARRPVGELVTPGNRYLEIEIEDLAREAGLGGDDVCSFTLYADANGGPVPCRVNHQLAYSGRNLSSSINVSLFNPNVFAPTGKQGRTWGQMMVGGPVTSRMALIGDSPEGRPAEVELDFYDETGQVADVRRTLVAGETIEIDPLSDLGVTPHADGQAHPLWVMAHSSRADISLFFVTRDRQSDNCSGEHGF
jgi:hypothetical protein